MKDLNRHRHFSKSTHIYIYGQQSQKEELSIPNHREMQIKITVRYHLTLIKVAITKKTRNNSEK